MFKYRGVRWLIYNQHSSDTVFISDNVIYQEMSEWSLTIRARHDLALSSNMSIKTDTCFNQWEAINVMDILFDF